MSDWRPIESAPKDGTPILAINARLSEPPEVVRWRDGVESGSLDADVAECAGWTDTGPFADRYYVNPHYMSHWMPLPPPPPTGG